MIFFLVIFNSFSQDSLTSKQKKQFLTDKNFKLKPSQIIKLFETGDKITLNNEYESTPFENAYNLNLFDYFNLNKTYDSELKKEVFKQTSDYKILLDSIKKIRISYLNSVYFSKVFDYSSEGPIFQRKSDYYKTNYIVNYDIQKKGFLINIGEVLPYHCLAAFCPKTINSVEFKQLSITKKYDLLSNSKNSYSQLLYIPMDATLALEIENNREQIEILRVFDIKGICTEVFNDNDFKADMNFDKTCKIKLVKGGNLRMLIYNKATDKIYYDQIYPELPQIKTNSKQKK